MRPVIFGLAKTLCVSLLLVTLVETHFDRSFRTPVYSLFLAYLIAIGIRSNNFIFTRSVLMGLLCNSFYAVTYFLVGPGSYLMAQVLTVCLSIPLLYSAMTMMDYDPQEVWGTFRKVQIAIYVALVAELIISFLGYQSVLESLLPQGTNRSELFGYKDRHNTFSAYFDLGYAGLSSLAMIDQGFAQFCVMLTIFGIRYFRGPFRISRFIFFVLVPIAMSIASPAVTSVVILVVILLASILIKAYLKIYSRMHVFSWLLGLPLSLYVLYSADLGFIRSYDLDLFYDIYVEPQLNFILSRSFTENMIGADTRIFEESRQQYEVAFLSYMTATGPVFFLLNVSVVVGLIFRNIRQVKYLYDNKLTSSEHLEMQIMNLLFIVAMLVSSIHYAVIGTYLGSMVFIINVSLGFYLVRTNTKLISASGRHAGNADAPQVAIGSPA